MICSAKFKYLSINLHLERQIQYTVYDNEEWQVAYNAEYQNQKHSIVGYGYITDKRKHTVHSMCTVLKSFPSHMGP